MKELKALNKRTAPKSVAPEKIIQFGEVIQCSQEFLFRHRGATTASLQYLLQTRWIEHCLVLQRRKAVVKDIVYDVKAVAIDRDTLRVFLQYNQLLLHG